MADRIGGRPYTVKSTGSSRAIVFHPMSENVKDPEANMFTLVLTSEVRSLAAAKTGRGTIGRRPYSLEKSGSKFLMNFYPQDKNAKYPDKPTFHLDLSREDLGKLAKLAR